ncbi:MAG: hypothetical protein DRG09_03910 [Epsilonproteobacteria bacterium]|nr:MAG: hypothetical protein DRG09_03910 [Campylobacterota bacterium]
MRYLLVTLTLLLSLTGCQDKKQLDEEAQAKHDAKIAQQARAEVLAELQAGKIEIEKLQKEVIQAKIPLEDNLQQTPIKEEKHSLEHKNAQLNQMGIHMENDSITIDTNKTKEFFNDLSKKLDVQMKKISADLEKGIIDTKEAGVEINEKHIHIDLNKTQNMLEDWGKKIQVFVQEFDEITNNIENNATN